MGSTRDEARQVVRKIATLLSVASLGTTPSCATADLSGGAARIALLPAPPVAGCNPLGMVRGVSGGFGGALLDNQTLRDYARNDALNQAAARGATHMWLRPARLGRNDSGGVDTAVVEGDAFVCRGQVQLAQVYPPAAPPSAPEPSPGLTRAALGQSMRPSDSAGAAIRATDAHLWRSWQGDVAQPGYAPYALRLDLDRAADYTECGRVEYPTLGCSATLTDCHANDHGGMEATQTLDAGSGGQCADGGHVSFALDGGKLGWAWSYPDGRPGSRGVLSPPDDNHALLAVAYRDLPALPPRTDPVLDEELYEVLPQFLPDVLPAGFVTDEPLSTRIDTGGQFRVVRRYQRSDGSAATVSFLLLRSTRAGATATLNQIAARAAKSAPGTIAGFPVLWRLGDGSAAEAAFIVVSPRLQIEIAGAGLGPKLVEDLSAGLHLKYLAQAEKGGRLAVSALGQRQTFLDPQGQKVQLAAGRNAFVDRVLSTEPGDKQGSHSDANLALGAPDYHGQGGYYSLGCRGKARFAFDDNVLVDGPGADLHIFEVGKFVESMSVRISEDGDAWIDAGQVKGQPASLDIAPVVRPGAQYRFVEISDLGDECNNESAGADIDAIGAINGSLVASPRAGKRKGAGAGRDAPDLTPRTVAEAVQRDEGVPMTVTVQGRGWTLLQAGVGYSVVSPGFVAADVNKDGRLDAIFIATSKQDQQVKHRLLVYTQRNDGLGLLASAPVGGHSAPAPKGNTVQIDGGNRITFESGAAGDGSFSFELRSGALIRLRP